MVDLLTGELQPVRRAPPPPRLPPPTSRKNVTGSANGDNFSNQLPSPLSRTLSTTSSASSNSVKSLFNGSLLARPANAGSSSHNKLQRSPSVPVARNFNDKNAVVNGSLISETSKKKAPPPRPPPPKIINRTQRLGGRRHDNLASGGQGFPLAGGRSFSNHCSPSTTETLLIDFSPPPRSPSLTASGSDGVSVNSFGSESSGTFFDAPTSWLNGGGCGRPASGGSAAAASSSNGTGVILDPFGSIEEEPQRLREAGGRRESLDELHVGWSSFYGGLPLNSASQASPKSFATNTNDSCWSGVGPRYDPDLLHTAEGTAIDWGAINSTSASRINSLSSAPPADPFSPPQSVITEPSRHLCDEKQARAASEADAARNNKPRYRPTIIRTKQPIEGLARGTALVDIRSDTSDSNGSSFHHSISAPAPLSSFGGYTAPDQGELLIAPNDQTSSSKKSVYAPIVQGGGGCSSSSSSFIDRNPDGNTFAVAEFDYTSNEPGDLCLMVGDRVELVAAISDDWLEGRLNGRQGLFPTSFVKILGSSPDSKKASTSVPSVNPVTEELGSNEVTAVYSFSAELPTDLTLQEGAVVTVTGVVEGGQWLLGHCNGSSGQFPANFVSHVPDNLPVITL